MSDDEVSEMKSALKIVNRIKCHGGGGSVVYLKEFQYEVPLH